MKAFLYLRISQERALVSTRIFSRVCRIIFALSLLQRSFDFYGDIACINAHINYTDKTIYLRFFSIQFGGIRFHHPVGADGVPYHTDHRTIGAFKIDNGSRSCCYSLTVPDYVHMGNISRCVYHVPTSKQRTFQPSNAYRQYLRFNSNWFIYNALVDSKIAYLRAPNIIFYLFTEPRLFSPRLCCSIAVCFFSALVEYL